MLMLTLTVFHRRAPHTGNHSVYLGLTRVIYYKRPSDPDPHVSLPSNLIRRSFPYVGTTSGWNLKADDDVTPVSAR
jgi:hypothetical protein